MDFKQFFEQSAFANTSPSSGPTHGMPQQQNQQSQSQPQRQQTTTSQNQLKNSFGNYIKPNDMQRFNTQFANIYKLRDPDQNKEYYDLVNATGEQLRKNQGQDSEIDFYNTVTQNLAKASPLIATSDPIYQNYINFIRTRDPKNLNMDDGNDGEKFNVPGIINKLSRANYDLGGVTSKAMQSGF